MRVFLLVAALVLLPAIELTAFAQNLPVGGVASDQTGHSAKPSAAMQAITINLALKDGKFYLGEIPSQITDESVEAVDQETLLKLAAPLLKEGIMEKVRRLPAKAGFLGVKDLKEAGLPFEFDIGQMTLSFFPTADQRPSSHITLSQSSDEASAEQLTSRASVSGYINLTGSAEYAEASGPWQHAALSPAMGVSGAIRVLDLVIESEASFSGSGKLARQGTRVLYDDPSNAVRYTAGDITPAIRGHQTGGGFLGVSVEKSYEKLQPQKNIRPTGQRSFRLERPSEVAISINGQIVRRIQMPPGDHDISELPLKAGENMLTLEITDDTGRRQTLKFTVFYDHALLAAGVSEWGFAAGYRSLMTSAGAYYDWRSPAVTGYYQIGVSEDLTATFHAQASMETAVTGVVAVTPTWLGRFAAEAAASLTAEGTPGLAMAMFYSPDTIFSRWNIPGVAQVAGEYRSREFTSLFASEGSLGELFSLNSFYTLPLPEDYTLSASGDFATSSQLAKPKVGSALTLSKSFQPDWDGSVTIAYDNSSTSYESLKFGGWSVLGRIAWKPSHHSEISFLQDGWHGRSTLGVATQGSTADGHYAVKADIQRDATLTPTENQADLSASYSGTRFDLSATRSRRFLSSTSDMSSDVSTISGATAIAFAGDHIAVGRPVSDSFAIVVPRDKTDKTTLQVPGEAFPRARSDSLSPALVSDLPSYSRSQFPIEADDPPAGYDLGSGILDVRPVYKSGFVLTAGAELGVLAMGNLEAEGKPLALISGLAKEEGSANPAKSVVYTNRAGRFSAEGLKPGHWLVEMLGEPPLCYRLTIPENATGIFDAGTLKPGACPR